MSPLNLNRLVQRSDLFRYVDGYHPSFQFFTMKILAGPTTEWDG